MPLAATAVAAAVLTLLMIWLAPSFRSARPGPQVPNTNSRFYR